MGEDPVPEYRVMLTTDIEDYSSRTDAEQGQLQKALAGVVNVASGAAGLQREKWELQVGGDSIFAIMPAGTSLPRIMNRFVRELDAELGAYNRRRAGQAWTRMRLRLAVHAGPVFLGGDIGWPGQHTVLPVRLRDCEPVRAAMKAVRAADLAVIVSGDVYRDYITQGPGSPRPTEFRAVLARPKKAAYLGHLMIPGFDVHAIGALARYDVPDEGRSAQHDAGDALDRELPPTAGRDFINGDKNRVSGGGSIYRSGRDIIIPGNQP